jgi:hypothetical protein
MATEYVSAASWSKKVVIADDGDTVFLPQTIAANMGVGVDATTGTVTIFSTLGTPDQIKADTCTWSAEALTTGEATITMPVSGIKVTAVGATVTFTNTTNLVNLASQPFTDGDVIHFALAGGTVPAELAADTDYYVVTADTNAFQVSATSGGAAITFTDNGTATVRVASIGEAVFIQ